MIKIIPSFVRSFVHCNITFEDRLSIKQMKKAYFRVILNYYRVSQCLENGKWDRPINALPNESLWPTWRTLRDRILISFAEVLTHSHFYCRRELLPSESLLSKLLFSQIRTNYTLTMCDAFVGELTKMSPPNLNMFQLKMSLRLSLFVITPDCFPTLKLIDLSSWLGVCAHPS